MRREMTDSLGKYPEGTQTPSRRWKRSCPKITKIELSARGATKNNEPTRGGARDKPRPGHPQFQIPLLGKKLNNRV